jgi:hypothetical protein
MKPINTTCPWSGKPVSSEAVTRHGEHVVGFCSTEHRDQFVKAIAHFAQSASPAVTTRAFDLARTGANVHETVLTPDAVRSRGIKRLFSLNVPGDARGCEAQPLMVSALVMADGSTHDVVFLASMANQVWAFDAMTARCCGSARWAGRSTAAPLSMLIGSMTIGAFSPPRSSTSPPA